MSNSACPPNIGELMCMCVCVWYPSKKILKGKQTQKILHALRKPLSQFKHNSNKSNYNSSWAAPVICIMELFVLVESAMLRSDAY